MNKLNLGCGVDYINNYLNFDTNPQSEKVKKVKNYIDLPVQQNSVDNIRAINTLNKIPRNEILPSIRKWYELLSEGGEIYLEIVDAELVSTLMSHGHMDIGEFNSAMYDNGRCTAFTLNEVIKLVKSVGFNIDEKGYMIHSAFVRLVK